MLSLTGIREEPKEKAKEETNIFSLEGNYLRLIQDFFSLLWQLDSCSMATLM